MNGGDKVEAEILEPYQVSLSDLLLSSRFPRDRKWISRNVMEALGPNSPGLLCVTGVLGSALLRRKLLPMARKLALLDLDKRNHILKVIPFVLCSQDWNFDLFCATWFLLSSSVSLILYFPSSSTVKGPPFGKRRSSQESRTRCLIFCNAAQFFKNALLSLHCRTNTMRLVMALGVLDLPEEDDEFSYLAVASKELGYCMRELDLSISRLCDREIGGGVLEESLLDYCTAKGRLIHYHSAADKCLLREAERRKHSGKRVSSSTKKGAQNAAVQQVTPRNGTGLSGSHFNLWQQWHYDHGIFTILTDPMFLSSYSYQECNLITTHSYLQIYHPSRNRFYMVKTPQDSFFIQIGESADILSSGKLRSTLHCVCRPEKLEHISRETFVVFLQPKWSQTFSVSEYTMEHLRSDSLQRQVPDTDDSLKHTFRQLFHLYRPG